MLKVAILLIVEPLYSVQDSQEQRLSIIPCNSMQELRKETMTC